MAMAMLERGASECVEVLGEWDDWGDFVVRR